MFKPTVSPLTVKSDGILLTVPTNVTPAGFPSGIVPTERPLLKVSTESSALLTGADPPGASATAEIIGDPAFLTANGTLPGNVRFTPLKLFPSVRFAAAAVGRS